MSDDANRLLGSAPNATPSGSSPAPDPTYLAHLEWSIATEARRRARFAAAPRIAGARRLTSMRSLTLLALIVVTATSMGAVGAIAVVQPSDVDVELAEVRARTRLELSLVSLRLAEERLEVVDAQYAAGFAPMSGVRAAKRARIDAETEVRLAESLHSEIAVRRGPPQDELGARPVRGRDFVAERVRMRLESLVRQLELQDAKVAEAEAMVARGFAPRGHADAATIARFEIQARIRELESLLDLRAQVVDDAMLPEIAELEARRLSARTALEVHLKRAEALQRQADLVEAQVAAGLASQEARRELQAEQASMQAREQLLEAEIEVVGRLLGRQRGR